MNVAALVMALRNFNSNKDVYLGKPSLNKEMEVRTFSVKTSSFYKNHMCGIWISGIAIDETVFCAPARV